MSDSYPFNPAHTYEVELKRGEFTDPARGGRVVPFKIYHPKSAGAGKFPVVFWSHGFGGNRDGAAFLSRHLAAHGYVVVHMTHFGTDSSLWEGKPGHPWDILRQIKVPRADSIARFLDVPFVLDALPGWAAENPGIGENLDLTRVGMSGHSYGSLTAQVMAGQMFPGPDEAPLSLKETRFRAAILYSPVPMGHLMPHESKAEKRAIYGSMDLPMLVMTGTQDDSPIEGFDYTARLDVYEYSGAREKFLLVKEGGDHMVYNGTRGKLEANPLRPRHEEIVKTVSLAFWDAELKGDKAARDFLKNGGLVNWLGSDARFERG